MSSFSPIDPLKAKQQVDTEVAANALKREIENILSSYVGWYDPFSELIQNALDSLDEKYYELQDDGYVPKLAIIVDLEGNQLTVSDNGVGLDKRRFEQFLAPSFSFKSGPTRGHKGVGATYLAYGFNEICIFTKHGSYEAAGKMLNARNWLTDPAPAGNPEIVHNPDDNPSGEFADFESGVSITLRFDSTTHPKQLSWLKATSADVWKKILLIKTGLGAFDRDASVEVAITVISVDGEVSEEKFQGIEYYWPNQIVAKAISYRDLEEQMNDLFESQGTAMRIPATLKNLECIYDTLDSDELLRLFDFTEDETELIERHKPSVHYSYMYTAKIWKTFNDNLGIRARQSILTPGIQICANNMPQGEIIQVPLTRNIGRQNQISVVAHFSDCKPDLGRKGFQKDIVDLSKTIGRKIIEDLLPKYRAQLRIASGVRPDLRRESEVSSWKRQIEEHEIQHPIALENEYFFNPVNRISISSEPTREQDVIALFNQLIAGGVIRGLNIMSTNERFTYDGMYRVIFTPPDELHVYESSKNPLGVDAEIVSEHSGWTSEAKILEYKFSLDGLIENINDGTKNSNDINLVVVWSVGTDYQGKYAITSLLNPENLADRQYHGVTHVMTNLSTGQKEMDLIVLEELLSYLNDSDSEITRQTNNYD